MASANCTIRSAVPEDIPKINDIHRYYVENTVITFIIEPNSDETMLSNYHKVKFDEGLPYLVAIDPKTEAILGYTYVVSFRGMKPGYRHTLELSLFCAPDQVRKGVGSQLLDQMIAILKAPEKWRDWFEGSRLLDSRPKQLIACMAIDVDMPGRGLKLRDWYLQRGFEQRAHLKEVGWKKERWIDTLYLQLTLRD